MRSLVYVLLVLLGACSKQSANDSVRPSAPPPPSSPRQQPHVTKTAETQPPNAPDQTPAFSGQTRAPLVTANVAFDVKVVAKGLEHPWALAFLPDGRMLVTEKPGRMRVVTANGTLSAPLKGVPKVDARGQGGLLDVIVDPDFQNNQRIYFSFAEPRKDGNGTAVAHARLRGDQLTDVKVIWRMKPDLDSEKHFGSRLVFSPDGMLFITTGERSILAGRKQAQSLDSAFGKIIRIDPDGRVPRDNPFVGREGALPEIWSYGHRNVQAAALNPETGALWVVDHGPRGGDEINVIEKGKNYGWPTITYGIEYSGEKIGQGLTQADGMEQPIYYWDPVIAPSGMAFYAATMFPAWRGSLFVGGLAGKCVARLTLDGAHVVGEERLLEGRARFRDVRVGPEGALYLLTDEDNGELLKLVPAEKREQSAGR
jgi:glucose/arabinose dehydrogenase